MSTLCKALAAGRTLGLRRLCSSCTTTGSAGEAASRSGWRCAVGGIGQRVALESASRAERRARCAHTRAFARNPNAYWNEDWDSPPAEAFAGSTDDDDDDNEVDGRLESQDVWAEWLNRDGFAQPLRAAQSVGLQGARALQQFADIWVDALLVLLPTAVPRQTVAQLVYMAVGCVVLYMVKVLLTTLTLVASATLGIVCLSRWLVYNGTVGVRRFDDGSDAAQPGQWPPEADERPRRSSRGYTSQQPSAEQRRSGADARYKQGDVVDVWYES